MSISLPKHIFKRQNEIHHSSQPERSVLLYNICIITAIISAALTVLGVYIDYELSWYVMPIASFCFFILAFWGANSGKLNLIGNLFVLVGAGVVISMILYSGGLYSPVVPWVAIGPTFALLLVDRLSAWTWTIIMMVVLFGFYLMEDLGYTPAPQYSLEVKPAYYIIVLLSLVALVLIINLIFESNTIVALNKVEDQKSMIAKKNQEILDSINYAQNIQHAILPSKFKLKALLPKSFVFFQPKDIVSGDFYWVNEKDDAVYLVAADCTGHGVPGAFMSMIGNELLNKIVLGKSVPEPGEILNELHYQLCAALQLQDSNVKDGMDVAICRIDAKKNEIQYAGAKNPLLIKRGANFEVIKGDREPIGGDNDNRDYTTHTVQAEKGDMFYIFSDGLQDQFGGSKDKKLKIRRIKELLLSKAQDMDVQKNALESMFLDWKGNTEQTDDILFIGFQTD